MMRCFVAVDITEEITDKLLDIQEEISETGLYNFLDSEKMHVTTKFLGEVDGIDQVRYKLREIRMNEFSLTVDGLGFFQNKGIPTVVWAGLKDNGKLTELNRAINTALGTTNDKPYSPHLTLARVKKCDETELFEVLKKYRDGKFGEVHVKEFVLYKSTPLKDRHVYTVLEKFDLQHVY